MRIGRTALAVPLTLALLLGPGRTAESTGVAVAGEAGASVTLTLAVAPTRGATAHPGGS